MKKLSLFTLIACLYSSTANALVSDLFYIRGDITATKFNNVSIGTAKYKHNYNFGGIVGFGYHLDNSTRVELIYNNMLADRFKYSTRTNNTYARITANIHAGLLRATRDILEVRNTTFFVGGGAGIANVNHKLKGFTDQNVATPPAVQIESVPSSIRSRRKNNFAYSLMFGGSVKTTENLRIETSYTFTDYGKTSPFRSSSGDEGGAVRLRSHNLTLGFRFDLI